jgi:hypothetical protein
MNAYVRIPLTMVNEIVKVLDKADPELSKRAVDSMQLEWRSINDPPVKNGRCMVVVSWPSGRSLVDTRIYLKEMGGFVGGMGEVVLWQPYPVLPGVTVPEVQS